MCGELVRIEAVKPIEEKTRFSGWEFGAAPSSVGGRMLLDRRPRAICHPHLENWAGLHRGAPLERRMVSSVSVFAARFSDCIGSLGMVVCFLTEGLSD